MKLKLVNHGKLKGSHALIDKEDFEKVSKYRWIARQSKERVYVQHLFLKNGKWSVLHLHRIIMRAPKGMDVDHINGNGLDNRKRNLRICTRSQNLMNGKKKRKNKYKGTSWDKRKKKWEAFIGYNHKKISLGYYKKAKEAGKAYNAGAKKIFGKFARLNKIT